MEIRENKGRIIEKEGEHIRKGLFILLAVLLFVIGAAPQAAAKSYSITDVHIRAWIKPDGNLLVNEKFSYDFEGSFSKAERSIQKAGHKGLLSFYAYELLSPDAEIGFVKKSDLVSLPVKREDNTYAASMKAKDEKKSFLYVYELKEAVKIYDTYSDLTVPFFGDGENHSQDLSNVKIDFVFPEQIKPEQYYAFMHDREGRAEKKETGMARFFTPVSAAYSPTETRLLFPSSVMSGPKKQKPPVSLEEAVREEERLAAGIAAKKAGKETLIPLLIAGIGAAALGCLALYLLLPQYRRRGGLSVKEILAADPLDLYMADRLGRQDHQSFLAGLYSLCDKGILEPRLGKTSSRMQKDPLAPDQTLYFSLIKPGAVLYECEQMLYSWLFSRKRVRGSAEFSLADAFGATKSERESGHNLVRYYTKTNLFKKENKEWFRCVLNDWEHSGKMKRRFSRLLSRGSVLLSGAALLFSYWSDGLPQMHVLLLAAAILGLAIWIWLKPEIKLPAIVYYTVMIVSSLLLFDEELMRLTVLFLLCSFLFYLLVPGRILSRETADLAIGIRRFRREFRQRWSKEDLAKETSSFELDRWMVRAVLLRTGIGKKRRPELADSELAAAAPLSYLVFAGEEPSDYLLQSWKWSKPIETSSSSDSGGSFGDFSSSGGDSGGGGGAD